MRRGGLGLGGSFGLLGRHDEFGVVERCGYGKLSCRIGRSSWRFSCVDSIDVFYQWTDVIMKNWLVALINRRRERSEGREGGSGRRARSRHVAVFIYEKWGEREGTQSVKALLRPCHAPSATPSLRTSLLWSSTAQP